MGDVENPNGVCFLGSGASAWAGVPTFNDFQTKAEEVCINLPEGSHEKGIFQRVLEHWKTHDNNPNLEEFYHDIELDERVLHNESPITSEDIAAFISITIQKSAIKTRPQSYYEKLIRILQDETLYYTIITTNWDILLESGREHYLRDGLINYGYVHAYSTLSNQTIPTYNILKLHGSLNWGFCEECKEAYYTDNKGCNIISSSEGLKCKKCNNKLKPLLVPPTISKLSEIKKPNYAPAQLIKIWRDAYKYLSTCEKIYFIGYSLPETDVETKHFISRALKENPNLKEVTIVTYQEYTKSMIEFEERYKSIISKEKSHPKIEFFHNGFEDFCDGRYIPNLSNLSGFYR